MILLSSILILFLFFPLAVGILAILSFGSRKHGTGAVGLLLHTISETKEPHCSYYSPEKFGSLLEFLDSKGVVFQTVAQAAGLSYRLDVKQNVVMTFDDGFESFYSLALPILSRHNFAVTVFPVAGYLGKRSTWDTLPPQTHLTKEHVREIAALGHEIGSHTMTHANLTLLSDADLADELVRSKLLLEDVTGKPVTSISFPFGQWNKRVWKAAQKAGYSSATSYAYRALSEPGIVPLWGIYSFDSVQEVIERSLCAPRFSNAVARGCVMPHFAKGTPLWKFRSNYAVLR
jgi:peptidoglycan/xylan/chitin deacetylase (PgdA/CDA1 family)